MLPLQSSNATATHARLRLRLVYVYLLSAFIAVEATCRLRFPVLHSTQTRGIPPSCSAAKQHINVWREPLHNSPNHSASQPVEQPSLIRCSDQARGFSFDKALRIVSHENTLLFFFKLASVFSLDMSVRTVRTKSNADCSDVSGCSDACSSTTPRFESSRLKSSQNQPPHGGSNSTGHQTGTTSNTVSKTLLNARPRSIAGHARHAKPNV